MTFLDRYRTSRQSPLVLAFLLAAAIAQAGPAAAHAATSDPRCGASSDRDRGDHARPMRERHAEPVAATRRVGQQRSKHRAWAQGTRPRYVLE